MTESTSGAQAGQARTRESVIARAINRFRRVAEKPFNLVFESNPERACEHQRYRRIEVTELRIRSTGETDVVLDGAVH